MSNKNKIYEMLYYYKDESSPSDVHKRVAKAIANNDDEYEVFLELMEEDIFRPNSPCLINAGISNGDKNNLCACYVFGLEDSMESIVDWWRTASLIYSGGGGVGVDIGRLREKNSPISTGGTSSGPIAFLKVIQSISEIVKSGGRSRRAANLVSMKYNHPDIMEFITCKSNFNLQAMNLSVLVDDEFFRKLRNDDYIDLISPNGNKKVGEIKASEIWSSICEHAWKTGDPGLLFYDNINRFNPIEPITTTNPCGEVPLPDFGACVIGSINLNKIVEDGSVNFDLFKKYIKLCTLFLDNIIDKTSFPHRKFYENMKKYRPIGLGIMGFADMLVKIGVEYGSEESVRLFEKICKTLTKTAYEASIDMVCCGGKEPCYLDENSKQKMLEVLDHYGVSNTHKKRFVEYGIRNVFVTCIAPTGSISISCDCSYAFEPYFALVWKKKLFGREGEMIFVNELFKDYLNDIKFVSGKSEEEIISDIMMNNGSIKNIDYIPDDVKRLFRTALDISPEVKTRIHGAGQNYITLGISTTYNLPNDATVSDVEKVFMTAYKYGAKGVTVFRDGCLSEQPVEYGAKSKKSDNSITVFPAAKNRPMIRHGMTVEVPTPRGTMFMTGNKNEAGELIEVFINLGKQNSLTSVLLNALGRVMSRSLQYGVPASVIVDTLIETQGEPFWAKLSPDDEKSELVGSIVDLIARLINRHFISDDSKVGHVNEGMICPKCGSRTLVKTMGCRGGTCVSCGYSECS